MADYANEPKIDFAVFKNKYAKTDRHPSEVGKIEFSREFMKAMVERAKSGQMPVLRVAMWERTSKAGMPYKNFRLELDRVRDEAPVEEPVEEADDELPF
mgnify:FL=1|jgi:hypothetical protein|tara:strand:- start:11772 stop:12068 length:297 start_codon:yes stop_codon:yes gene_type:complete